MGRTHTAAERHRKGKFYVERKEAGLCVSCGRAAGGFVRCEECRETQKRARSRRISRAKPVGADVDADTAHPLAGRAARHPHLGSCSILAVDAHTRRAVVRFEEHGRMLVNPAELEVA